MLHKFVIYNWELNPLPPFDISPIIDVQFFFVKYLFIWKMMLGRFKFHFSNFQHMRNNYAKYTLCCVFVNNNPKVRTINNFFKSGEFHFQQFCQTSTKNSPFFQLDLLWIIFLLNVSHKYGIQINFLFFICENEC